MAVIIADDHRQTDTARIAALSWLGSDAQTAASTLPLRPIVRGVEMELATGSSDRSNLPQQRKKKKHAGAKPAPA
jgi:hypothetical protein